MSALLIIAIILVILGVIGSMIPALPGPVFAYAGLVILFFEQAGAVSLTSLIVFGVLMTLLIIIDYLAPVLGAKFSGASRQGVIGSIVGGLLGVVFFPPLGIFLGAFIGAVIGELTQGREASAAIKAGIGTLVGSVSVIVLQTIFAISVAVWFFVGLV